MRHVQHGMAALLLVAAAAVGCGEREMVAPAPESGAEPAPATSAALSSPAAPPAVGGPTQAEQTASLPPMFSLRKGDLVFCEVRDSVCPEPDPSGFDHVAVYAGGGWCVEATCAAASPRVRLVPLALLRLGAAVTYGRVKNASPDRRQGAVDFALGRLGDGYQYIDDSPCVNHDPYDPTDPFADRWYGSELVWAAWYRQGFDLGDVGPAPYPCTYVSPQDIADDDDVEILDVGGLQGEQQ